ncbi:MAG: glycoside hydrolase family 65 protein [Muribaculaceae bacterium]
MRKILFGLIILSSLHIMAQDPWKIKVENITSENYFGVTVGNGMLGLVSAPEPFKNSCVVLAGCYDKYGRGGVSNFLNGFDMLNTSISISGIPLVRENISDFSQTLDMKEANFSGDFELKEKAKVNYSFRALRQLPHCALLVATITAIDDIELSVKNTQDIPDAFRDGIMTYNEIQRRHASVKLLSTRAGSPTGKLLMCASSAFIFPEKPNAEPRVIHNIPNNNNHSSRFVKTLKKGETYRFGILGTSITSSQHPDAANEAERLTIFGCLEGIDRLISNHNRQWNELWKSDIEIVGDAKAQQEIHSMIYHLYSFVREGSRQSISPMGLSGLGYNGHIFWDADTWIFPALLMLQPKIAKSMIDYRFDRLNAAKANAAEHGFNGAMYPWESSDTGFEETPTWAFAGTFEHHITACVGNAAWLYYCVSQDLDWLKREGYEIISATADFWISRAELDSDGKYHIKNVVAADEYAENVDDNAYTNAAASVNLKNAIKAANLLGVKENSKWNEVANKLIILSFKDGITREHSSYEGQNIKQADVNLLAYPLGVIKDKSQILKDLEFYAQKVPQKNTPAMTQAIFSLLYSRIGNKEMAYKYFIDAYRPNMLSPFGVIAETKGGTNPYFITGAGGVLQSVIMGFCGLEITPKGIIQLKNTVFPENWDSITLKGIGVEKRKYTIQNR